MEQNVGYFDRFVRLVVSAFLIVFFVAGVVTGALGVIMLLAGIVIMITSVIGFCPIYSLLKINSCRVK